jgi:demethoxyubiquinone hydroxylase (CLK1/Coq7/Cat5 family)
VDCCVNELSAFAAWIRRENRSRPTIVRALELRASYLLGVASQTVDISGASTAMQACGGLQ